jgi:uncharacterized protein
MKETPLFFPRSGRSLFGILHEPRQPTRLPPFVFCHPFGEEKLWTHRVFVSFARRLAERGHVVLRFDYLGNGDSDGDFSESSLSSAIADVHAAIDHVRRAAAASRVSLLGLRLGATIASLVAEEAVGIQELVLWAPIVDGGRYMQELLRTNLTTQMATFKEIRQDREALVSDLSQGRTVNVDGYEIAQPMYADVSAISLGRSSKRFNGPCLVAQLDRQIGRPSQELELLVTSYANATLLRIQEEPFWKEIATWYAQAPNLFGATQEWLVGARATVATDASAQ